MVKKHQGEKGQRVLCDFYCLAGCKKFWSRVDVVQKHLRDAHVMKPSNVLYPTAANIKDGSFVARNQTRLTMVQTAELQPVATVPSAPPPHVISLCSAISGVPKGASEAAARTPHDASADVAGSLQEFADGPDSPSVNVGDSPVASDGASASALAPEIAPAQSKSALNLEWGSYFKRRSDIAQSLLESPILHLRPPTSSSSNSTVASRRVGKILKRAKPVQSLLSLLPQVLVWWKWRKESGQCLF
jgi:hypothetical protein